MPGPFKGLRFRLYNIIYGAVTAMNCGAAQFFFRDLFAKGRDDRRADRPVRHEVPVHDVHVDDVRSGGLELILQNGEHVTVARRAVSGVKKALGLN